MPFFPMKPEKSSLSTNLLSKLVVITFSMLLVLGTFLCYFISITSHRTPFIGRQINFSTTDTDLAIYRSRLASVRPADSPTHSPSSSVARFHTFGVASRIYVLSLARRKDRRTVMDTLSHALDLEFVYMDGVEATSANIDHVMYTLELERYTFQKEVQGQHKPNISNIFDVAFFGGSDSGGNSTVSPFEQPELPAVSFPTSLGSDRKGNVDAKRLSCATPDNPFPAPLTAIEFSSLPPWRVLSRGMIACWMGHLNIIRTISQMDVDVGIVLEDDVDMEFNITARLMNMWPALPQNGWDIVMLGHCHSNERKHPPLVEAPSLRLSFAPKCTHAYAVSNTGAKKLSHMLSVPGFAYSRALDQALSWLISTRRIRSYSVVPAVIVQSKRTNSDIWQPHMKTTPSDVFAHGEKTKGSGWRDILVDSTLERVQMMADAGWDLRLL